MKRGEDFSSHLNFIANVEKAIQFLYSCKMNRFIVFVIVVATFIIHTRHISMPIDLNISID